MFYLKKINLKLYLILTMSIFLLFSGFAFVHEHPFEMLAIILVAILISQMLFVVAVGRLLDHQTQNKTPFRNSIMLIVKSFVLFFSFYIGVHFYQDKIIVAVFLYIAMLSVLLVSLKRD